MFQVCEHAGLHGLRKVVQASLGIDVVEGVSYLETAHHQFQ